MRDEDALSAPPQPPGEGRSPRRSRRDPAVSSCQRSWRHLTHRRSPWCAHEPTHAQQIVRGADQERVQLRARDAPEARLAQAPGGLRPPKDLLHALPAALAHGKTRVPLTAKLGCRNVRPSSPGRRRPVMGATCGRIPRARNWRMKARVW